MCYSYIKHICLYHSRDFALNDDFVRGASLIYLTMELLFSKCHKYVNK